MGNSVSKPFAVFDIDGTLIRWQLNHAIVNELGRNGYLPADVHQKIRDARHTWKSRTHSESFTDYEEALITSYHGALTGLSVKAFLQAIDTIFELYKDQVYTYTRDLIRKLKAHGYMLFVISGSQQEVVQKLGDYYDFDKAVGTKYERVDGHFTGKRDSPYARKGEVLQELVKEYGLDWKGSIAVGDTRTDIAMLELVENPIAFNPNRQLFEHALTEQWKIVVERKNVSYELQSEHGQYVLGKTNN